MRSTFPGRRAVLRIHRTTDYAIRFLLSLAKRPAGARLSTDAIRREMHIPAALAQRIVAGLARGGFVETFPGREGGVQLGRQAAQISLLQVVEHFEGPLQLSDCMTDRLSCPFDASCVVRGRWDRLQSLMRAELADQTFAQMAEETLALEGRMPRAQAV